MPINATNDTQGFDPENFFHNGELTLEAETIYDFLVCADFSALNEHPEVAKHITTTTQENADGEQETIHVLPGDVASQLVDDDDMVEMFIQYVDSLPEETLEDVARKTAVAQLLDEKFKKGMFKKLAKKGKAARNMVGSMMNAMRLKGVIKQDADGGHSKKNYPAGKESVAKKMAKKAKKWDREPEKNKKGTAALRKLVPGKSDESVDVSEVPVFGQAFGVMSEGEHFSLAISLNPLVEGVEPTRMTLPKPSNLTEGYLTTPMHRGAGLAGSVSKLMEREQ